MRCGRTQRRRGSAMGHDRTSRGDAAATTTTPATLPTTTIFIETAAPGRAGQAVW